MIRLSKSSISKDEKKAVNLVLEKEFLGMGEQVNTFEKELSSYFGRNAICTVNGTASLQLALESIGVKRGDEILLPSLNYLSAFQAISATGAKPIPVDINEKDLTMNIDDTLKKISKRTRALMPMHYSGTPCDLKNIYKIATKYNLRVIEDACHAFGSKYNNKLIGSFGDIACFSFDGIKNITSGEGGCIVTNDRKVIKISLSKRSLGISDEYKFKYMNKRKWDFDVQTQGWRYHMSNIMAAIGIVQLRKFTDKKKRRKRLAKNYNKLLSANDRIQTFYNEELDIVPHIYVIRIRNLKNKKKLRKDLFNLGIETGEHYKPNHLLSLYKSKIKLKNTELIFPELLSLPLHTDLTSANQKFISDSLNVLLK